MAKNLYEYDNGRDLLLDVVIFRELCIKLSKMKCQIKILSVSVCLMSCHTNVRTSNFYSGLVRMVRWTKT